MILGVGTDMVQISRIERSLSQRPRALPERVLTPEECQRMRVSARPAAYLAKRFAAKEAAVKALGTGIGEISWQDLEVDNDERGAPSLICRGAALARLRALGGDTAHLSLSDEGDLALAFVVISASGPDRL